MRISDEKYPIFLIKCFDSMGITKAQAGAMFAKIAGIEESAGKDLIYRYCAGTRRPGRENAIHLAKLLNMSVEEVLNGQRTLPFVPTLRTTFSQRGDNLLRYIEALEKEGFRSRSTPLYNKDEFNYDALDYCILNNNSDGILYLIKNNYCKLTKHFSHISHPNNNKPDLCLLNLSQAAVLSDDVELFELIYPKTNRYVLSEESTKEKESFELYETCFDQHFYPLFNKGQKGKLPLNIHKNLFSPFKLDEKIFMQRNSCLIKNENLMNLYSFHGFVNILALKLRSFDEELLETAMVENGVILESIYDAGITDPKKLKLDKDGRLFLIENSKKYWLTTLIILPKEALEDKSNANVEMYKRSINVKDAFEEIKNYKSEEIK